MRGFLLRQNEYDSGLSHACIMCLLVLLFGMVSALTVLMVCVEAGADTFKPLVQNGPWDWSEETLSREIPVVVALLATSLLGALTIGLNSLYRGGIMSFFSSLCNIFPLLTLKQNANEFSASPVMWIAFGIGILSAFYVGDLASWWCRRRFLQEKQAENVRNLRLLYNDQAE